MTACFWAERPLESQGQSTDGDGVRDDPRPYCPRCDTPVLVGTCLGSAEHVATPCGCRVSGDLLERNVDTDTGGST